ncbi:hypothetical protein WJX82_004302 [Trebouxia sp. C0006]
MQVQVLKASIAPQRLTSSKAFSSDFTFRFGYRIWCLRRNALSFWQILFRPNSQAAESVHLYNQEPMAFCTLELIAGSEASCATNQQDDLCTLCLGSRQLCGSRAVVVSSFSAIGPSGPVANSQVVESSLEPHPIGHVGK